MHSTCFGACNLSLIIDTLYSMHMYVLLHCPCLELHRHELTLGWDWDMGYMRDGNSRDTRRTILSHRRPGGPRLEWSVMILMKHHDRNPGHDTKDMLLTVSLQHDAVLSR
jgi:hypothetical protein